MRSYPKSVSMGKPYNKKRKEKHMKKSQIITTMLMAGMLLAGCSNKPGNTSNTENPTTSNPGTTTTTPTPSMEHQNPLVRDLAEGALVRDYKEDLDTMVNDFSGASLVGETENGVFSNHGTLRVLVDSQNEDFPGDSEVSIYKMATGTYQLQDYDSIGFVIRKVNGTINYSNLVLGLRGDDAWDVYPISLANAMDEDGNELPELTSEFQTIKISPNLSIEDADTEYTLKGTSDKSGTKVLSKYLGFHLYAKDECSSLIEIQEVFLEKAGEKTVLDSFARKAVNKADETCWWRDSTGFIVTPGITLKDGASYTTPDFELGENTNVVLNVLGDTTGTSIAPITSAGAGEKVAWADLKDENNESVKNAVNGAFHSLAINLKNSNLAKEGLKGFKITSTNEIVISQVFLSSLKEKEAVKEYPHLDTANAVHFDDFSRKQSGFNGNYEESSNSEIIKNAGLYYALSYNNGDKVNIDGDAAVFDSMPDGYTQLKEGSTRGRTTQRYLVFKMKLEGEGDLNGFRFSNGTGDAYYASSWKAGEGLPSIPEDMSNYPYKDEDGYALYIIDLKASNMEGIKDCLDMYYTGSAVLKIDSIFFADEYEVLEEVEGYVEAKDSTTLGKDASYMGNTSINKASRYVSITLTGDGTATLESIRFTFNGEEFWIKDGKWVLKGGEKATLDHVISTEGETYVIDLLASNVTLASDYMHFFMGGYNNAQGAIQVNALKTLNKGYQLTSFIPDGTAFDIEYSADSKDPAYHYGGYFAGDANFIALKLSSAEGATLNSFRINFESNGEVKWAKDASEKGKGLVLLNADGTAFDYTQKITDEVIIYIDLVASGLEVQATHLHFNLGAFGDDSGTLTVKDIASAKTTISYSDVLNNYVEL